MKQIRYGVLMILSFLSKQLWILNGEPACNISAVVETGTIECPGLIEASGLVASRCVILIPFTTFYINK